MKTLTNLYLIELEGISLSSELFHYLKNHYKLKFLKSDPKVLQGESLQSIDNTIFLVMSSGFSDLLKSSIELVRGYARYCPVIGILDNIRDKDLPQSISQYLDDILFLPLNKFELRYRIDKAKQMQEKLLESEQRYREIFQVAKDAIYLESIDGNIIDANLAACKMLGYDHEELTHMSIKEIIPSEFHFQLEKGFYKSKANGTYIVSQNIRKDGTRLWVEVSHRNTVIDNKNMVMVFVRDVTERKEIEKSLYDTHQIYRSAIENAEGVPYRFNFKKKEFEYLGENSEKILGIAANKFSFERLKNAILETDALHEDSYKDFDDFFDAFHSKRITQHRGDVKIDVPGKGERWFSDCSVPIRDNEYHEIVGVMGILQDITERKTVEKKLRESEIRYRQLFEDASGVSVFGYNINREILFWNKASEDLYKYSWNEVCGKKIEDVLIPEDTKKKIVGAIDRWKNSGVPMPDGEFEVQNREGQTIPIHASHVMLKNVRNEPEFYCIGFDISDRKKALQEEKRYSKNMKILSDSAIAFVEMTNDVDLYRYIGNRLYEIMNKRAIIIINKYNEFNNEIQTHSITGALADFEKFKKMFKIDLIGSTYVVPPYVKQALLTTKLQYVSGGLKELMFDQVSQRICDYLEKRYRLGKIYSMGIVKRGHLFGNAVLVFRKGYDITNNALIEAFIHQASIALQKRVAENSSQYRMQVEKLVSDISSRFINSKSSNFSTVISESIRLIAEFTAADRTRLILFDLKSLKMKSYFSYNNEGANEQEVIKDMDIRKYRYFYNELKTGKAVVVNSIDDLPSQASSEKNWLLESGYGAVLLVPLICSNKIYGILCLSNKLGHEREWPYLLVSMLKFICDIIVASNERKNIEARLRETSNRYSLATNAAKVGVWDFDLKSRQIYVDPILIKLLGFSANEIGNKLDDYKKIIYEGDFKKAKKIFKNPKELNNIKKNGFSFELRMRTKTGSIKWMLFQGRAVFENNLRMIRIVGTSTDISSLKEFEQDLKISRNQLRKLMAHSQFVMEEERKQIAREIHDELGQSLAALKMDLSWLRKKIEVDDVNIIQKIQDMFSLIDSTVKSVKKISANLRPDILDNLGLAAAIEWQTQNFEKHSGIRSSLSIVPEDLNVDKNISIAIFRIYQEALTNVIKHSRATRVDVWLKKDNKCISLVVKDNGVGIQKQGASSSNSFGLIGMKERAQSLSGHVNIKSSIDMGTTVEVVLPLNKKGL